MKIILYETDIKGLLPITYTRPAFDIFCGATTLRRVICDIFNNKIDFKVREEISEIVRADYISDFSDSDFYLYLDASLIPSFFLAKELFELLKGKESATIFNSKKAIGFLSKKRVEDIEGHLKSSVANEPIEIDWPTFEYSWETVIFNQKILAQNLDYLKKNYKKIKPGVFVGENVELSDNVVFETKKGIIIIDEGSKILPFSCLFGPLYIGKNCLIKEFASIKDNCCFGPVCKIGGEVEATIIQGYSNKQHYGFLGHSYLGEWINIAAGTSNSDLKNTYSTVKVGGTETGQQFLGTIIGDFSHTAINTSIFTGRIIGVSSFVYGTITKDIVSFTNYAAHLGCVIELALPVAIKAQQAMFARRNREQTTEDINILTKIFEITKSERSAQNIFSGRLEFKI